MLNQYWGEEHRLETGLLSTGELAKFFTPLPIPAHRPSAQRSSGPPEGRLPPGITIKVINHESATRQQVKQETCPTKVTKVTKGTHTRSIQKTAKETIEQKLKDISVNSPAAPLFLHNT